ncbi:baseplate assembly protein [Acinetobacter venetianus]|uniref:GPW/gp25 family protein n=1 Tax=Acinetobacter venetianus TaxID=52133 RepID=UPI0007757E36|nr:GPW/gp25 family protein [Acinetobacter venetianus]KXO86085.1 baseplate assembly protein [Acinetobacter venetianus]
MMSRTNGKNIIVDLDHIYQSIQDIVTTPIGSRVMRREYGSLVFKLIDGPYDDILQMQLYAAIATAIIRWEPRVSLHAVSLNIADPGAYVLDLDFTLVDNNQRSSLRVPLAFGATN